jgi:ribosome recycling factor
LNFFQEKNMEEQSLKNLQTGLKKAVDHLVAEFSTIHAGKAAAAMVESVPVEAYGAVQPLKNMAAITTPDARTIAIQPWDRGTTKAIERAILLANVGFTPIADADRIRCVVPEMSRERRQELVKRAEAMAETGKISLRTVRREVLEVFKAAQRKGILSEDDLKRLEKEVQKRTDDSVGEIVRLLGKKSNELLAV